MTWTEVKLKIKRLLESRNLSKPQIRLNALARLDELLGRCLPEVIRDPATILNYDKADVISKLEKLKKLNSAEKSIINNIYQVVSGGVSVARPRVSTPDPVPLVSDSGNKLQPIAECLSKIFEQSFRFSAPFEFEVKPTWLLSVPDHSVYKDVWGIVSAVYAALIDEQWTLSDRLRDYVDELKVGRQRADIWFSEPYNCIVEFDEKQHFNQFRLRTLEQWSDYGQCSFGYEHYRELCQGSVFAPGTTGFKRLKSVDPLFPPMFNGEDQDNRIRQRAFRDFLKDITPQVVPWVNPTIRISYRITNGRIRDFTAEDFKAVEEYMVRCGGLERMRLS